MKLAKLREIEKSLSRIAFQDHPSGLSAKDLKMKNDGLIHKFFDPSGKVDPVYFPKGIPESKIKDSLEKSYGVKLDHENLEDKMNNWAEKNAKVAAHRDGELACDMSKDCKNPVSYIDKKGFVYCENHGLERKQYVSCRKLKPSELKDLKAGNPIKKY